MLASRSPCAIGVNAIFYSSGSIGTLRGQVTNQKWVADFTYIWTAEGWLYAAAVMDLYSRRIVGWSMSDTMQAKMVSDALLMALWRRGKPSSLMHHSDQGSQYTSDDFHQLLKAQGITCSMSRRGECWTTPRWRASSHR